MLYKKIINLFVLIFFVPLCFAESIYWNVFNIEGEGDIGADIVWYDTFDDMLSDDNRQGVGQTDAFGGGFNANIVDSGSDGERFWNVFNIEDETTIGADIVWYDTFDDMLNDDNRQGVGQTDAFGGGFNANIVGSGSDGENYWNVFNIESEGVIGADIVWYNSFDDMLNDDNRQGVGQTDAFGGGFNSNIVGSGSDGENYWNVFNIEGESSIGADIVWYGTFEDMLSDDNRLGVGQTDAFGGGFNTNIIGAGGFIMDSTPVNPVPISIPFIFTLLGGVFALRIMKKN